MNQQNLKPKASIIILDFLKAPRVCENVESLQKQKTNFPFEIIVVDNSAKKENADQLKTLEKFENVKVVINHKNVGYIQGNNRGVEASSGEYIFIVNPDIICRHEDTLQKMVNHLEAHPEIGVLGPKQINDTDQSVAMTVRAFPKLSLQIARRTRLRKWPVIKHLVAHDEMQHLNYEETQPVDWIQSSFWLTTRKLWDQLEGLDDRYFIFMSDPDYCHKCWSAGYQVVYCPEVTVYADGKRASAGGLKKFFKSWVMQQHFKDAIKYRLKYFGKKNPRKIK